MAGYRNGDRVDFTTGTGGEFTGKVVDYEHDLVAAKPRYVIRVEGKGTGPVDLRATADNMRHTGGAR